MDVVRRLESAASELEREYHRTIQTERAARLRDRASLLRDAATEIESLRERLIDEVKAAADR